jgi:predicted phage terminase large subunit-like protein
VKLGEDKTGHVYVLDVVRLQEDWQNVVPTMKRVILADGNKVKQGVEKQGYMSRAVKDLNRDIELKNYQITGHKVDTSKTVRAMPLQSRFAEGVLRVTLAHWTQAFTEEFVLFPNGSHDDQVDATAGAWAMLYPDNEIKPLQAEGMRYA